MLACVGFWTNSHDDQGLRVVLCDYWLQKGVQELKIIGYDLSTLYWLTAAPKKTKMI
jgi:hypothetical protein